MAVGSLLSHGAPDSPVRHRTLFGTPATSASCWGSTVGALTCWASGLSGGAPDKSCRLSGAPPACAMSSARADAHLMRCSQLLRCSTPDSPVNYSGADSRSWRVQSCFSIGHQTLSGGTPDNPVNYSGVPLRIPEGEELSLEFPGAPDTVRWHTGQSGAPDHGCLRVVFCSLCLNPFLVFLLV
jgi:hypothetical protein